MAMRLLFWLWHHLVKPSLWRLVGPVSRSRGSAMACHLPGCPDCYASIKGRSERPGHRGSRSKGARKRGRHEMGMLKRPVVRQPDGLPSVPADSPLARSYPALFAFLVEASWDDDSPRETGTVMLLSGDGLVKLWVHDRDGPGRSAWFSGEALEDVLAAADDALATGSGDWRPDKPKAGTRSPRRS